MKRNTQRFIVPGLLFALAILIASCSKYPTYTVNTSDMDMIWTNYDESANFADFKTYYVPDSIILEDDVSQEDAEALQKYYDSVLKEVNDNMAALNYVRVDSTDDPDLGLGITIITRTTHVISYNYWYYYPPYWGWPGYGYYYPWGTYMGSYEEGAVIIDMANLKAIDHTNKRINAIWAALVGGVLSGDKKTVISSRLINGIDQAFKQSPYLGTE
ncbi:MAG TPA: DUF4136 domain-containing protein [Bacteroidales bacterium]|nr:DUF4136 domain-containing protein [Bacteroidales bacterium]